MGEAVRHVFHARGDRRHVDDAASAPFQYAWQSSFDRAHNRVDVEIVSEVKIGLARVEDRAVLDYSGAVEQHVDPADLRKEGGDGGGIEDVELTAVQLRAAFNLG